MPRYKGKCNKCEWKKCILGVYVFGKGIYVDRHGVWQMLRVYRVGGKLLKAVHSLNVNSRASVRAGNDE